MILRIIKRVFLFVALAFLAYFAWQSREILLDVVRSANLLTLAAAVIVWTLMHALAPLVSVLVFRARNVSMPYRSAAHIHIDNLPARYIPGGIWHTVGRVVSFRKLNISQRDISIFVYLENALAACMAFIIGGLLLAEARDFDAWGQIGAVSAVGGAAVLAASPLILSLRIIRGDARFPLRSFVLLTLVTAAIWSVAATAFVTFVAAFPGLGLGIDQAEIAGAYLFSWAVGFVSIFAPQGIGVFEVVAAELMSPAGTFMSVAALMTGFRLVILSADTAVWLIWSAIFGQRTQDLL